jgi:hypothetical protein
MARERNGNALEPFKEEFPPRCWLIITSAVAPTSRCFAMTSQVRAARGEGADGPS